MKVFKVSVIAICLVLGAASSWAQVGKGYKVIVNPANPLVSISRDNLSNIFLKRTTKFPNGLHALPVDLPINLAIRDSFSKDVHGKPASAVEAYWQQLIFSGRDVPPPQKSEKSVVDFVRSNEDGVGYVSVSADTTGVKVVNVTK